MNADHPGEITALLRRASEGEGFAQEALIEAVYSSLKGLAAAFLRNERPGHTLQTTALVHEAYLRLIHQQNARWENRLHFFAIAARIMRRVLVDYARSHNAGKRGGGRVPMELRDGLAIDTGKLEQLIALEEALGELAKCSPRLVQVAELRFFAGLSVDEVAQVLQMSTRQVKRDWKMGRSWLRSQLALSNDT